MPYRTFKNRNAERQVERLLLFDRLKAMLKAGGIVLLILGTVTAISPFGPPVSNPVAIPKADPGAGLRLIQMLPAGRARAMGLTLALVGGVMIVCSFLLRNRE